jgi:flagellar biogenesis protein FliO
MLMDVLNSIIVVGIANNQITMLTTISDSKSLEKLNDLDRGKKNSVSLFDNLTSYRSKLLASGQTRRKSRENE